jgi:branched-chain amino acid transport system permease protein
MIDLWANVLVSGLLIGLVYALVALGLTVIFGVMRIVNFAHGEMVVAGMYIGYGCSVALGLPAPVAAVVAATVLFVAGYWLQRLVVQHFVARPEHVQFILFIGIALVVTGLHLMLFGPDARAAESDLSFAVLRLGPLNIDVVRLQAAVASAALIAGLGLFLKMSRFGRSLRGAADNRTGGLVIGLNIPRIYAITSGIGAACAGAAGALVSPIFDVQPFLAVDMTMIAFITVIVGGLGSFPGALVAGLFIGVSEAAAALLIAPAMKSALSYALLVIVLLLRPRGLFNAKAT